MHGLTNFGTQCYGLTVLRLLTWFKLYTHNIYIYFIWIWQPVGWITIKYKHDKHNYSAHMELTVKG